jgi:hypothetical protein
MSLQMKCLVVIYLFIYAARNKSWSDSSLSIVNAQTDQLEVALEGWVVVTYLYLGF